MTKAVTVRDAYGERSYDNPRYVQFVQDMNNAGIEVQNYDGRFGYQGPAAKTSDEIDADDIVRATSVRLKRDALGKRTILYPS